MRLSIIIPEGGKDDSTRNPEWYDGGVVLGNCLQ